MELRNDFIPIIPLVPLQQKDHSKRRQVIYNCGEVVRHCGCDIQLP